MRKIILLIFLNFMLGINAQHKVSNEKMVDIYEEVKTPYKYGLVIAPNDNNHKIDCPTVFRDGDKWLMTYVVYNGKTGTDGRGYETWLAKSDNLLEWETVGRVLSYRDGKWDANQRGGFPALPDMEWGGSYKLHSYKGKHWMTYLGGEGTGYEAVRAPLNIGLAWTNKPLHKAGEWNGFDTPILSINDKDAQWWEKMTQYKSTIYWDKTKKLGAPFVMFYNAGGRNPENGVKGERVGIALSHNMKKWKRYGGNPIFSHEADGTITGDAHIQKMGDLYVMFYFSAFDPTRKYKAFNTFAASYDLVNWTEWSGKDLIYPTKSYDEMFAHKSYVIKHNGVVYHFYCAVNSAEQRGIAVATSKPMGRSFVNFPEREVKNRREEIRLTSGWKTWLEDKKSDTLDVSVPHNWDNYYGYRQLTHGNLHGNAIYRKEFTALMTAGKRYFLRFEGVGSYATVLLNSKKLGRFISGRTTFTIDVTEHLKNGKNIIEVKAEHPEMISDLPWVCGGCSSEWGFSEGSQPLGIFRPVVLEVTDEVRIEPFGVHIWNSDRADSIFIDTELKNYGNSVANIELVNKFSNADGKQQFRIVKNVVLKPGETKVVRQSSGIADAIMWDTSNPYLYKLSSMIKREGKTIDELSTPFGIRTISWPVKRNDNDGRFYLNGKPQFINGVCEYEHQFGASHSFTDIQIESRVKQIINAGFNAFRDAHQPHNLEYQKHWDKNGILFWTQFSAHIWYDTPEFRDNFKRLLIQWVKERRNSPSVIMWGLQNESVLPKEFAEECCDIIRKMDPTANNMRIITTCNGGSGTDWDVVQNWSGTYGGNLNNYNIELSRKDQLLNGEYGAWRSLGLHTEPAPFDINGVWSEERMCYLMETKIRLAEQVKDSVCGQFQWIYSSHDNPGRRQPDEAYRKIDKVGPFNYKGLVTPWEEPLDVYYMYKSNYVDASKEPFVYLVSHTWNDRFKSGRRRATIEAYSNCDSLKLYNGATETNLLGVRKKGKIGSHFVWENSDICYNVLHVVGYYGGKRVCEDFLLFDGLEKSSDFNALYSEERVVPIVKSDSDIKGDERYNYIYRINCGGDEYIDSYNQRWMKDTKKWSSSWADKFITEGDSLLSPYQASQRFTNDPIGGTKDWTLVQTFRFGREKLCYNFPVRNGKYRVELYFIEPWHGTGGSAETDCEGLRVFDVAINDNVAIKDIDIWAEAGHDNLLKKVIYVDVTNGVIKIDFPTVEAGQAVISAIAIASQDNSLSAIYESDNTFSWKEFNDSCIEKTPKEELPEDKNERMLTSYEAESAMVVGNHRVKEFKGKKGVFFEKESGKIEWNISTGLAQIYALRFKYMNDSKEVIKVRMQLIDAKGVVLKDDELTFAPTPGKWRMSSTTTGGFINAGHYKVVLSSDKISGLSFDCLDVQ